MIIETKLNLAATTTIRTIMLLLVVVVVERGERGIKPKEHE